MGGIFGVVCSGTAPEGVLYEGLRRLLYRGYDGAGYAYLGEDGRLVVRKKAGHLERVADELSIKSLRASVAVAHTRYASRGWPKDENAHPLTDCGGRLAVVMDGVIDDYESIREELMREGHVFRSTTDAEVLAHLLEGAEEPGRLQRVIEVARSVGGVYAFAALFEADPRLYIASRGQPLVVGVGEKCYYVSSDIPSLYGFASEAVVLGDGNAAVVEPGGFRVYDVESGGEVRQLVVKRVKYHPGTITKAGYPHYMLKEIYEVPQALRQTIHGLMEKYLSLAAMIVHGARNVYIIGNGTSLHAGLVASYYFADLAKVNTDVVSAAEFPYYALENVMTGTVIIAVSQSGETSDVIQSVRLAKRRGAVVVGVTNVVGSRLTLESNVYLPIGAGPEIAVPATKTYASTLAALLVLAAYTGLYTGSLGRGDLRGLYEEVERLASRLEEELPRIDREAERLAAGAGEWRGLYVTSSGINYPVALEAALKFKEAAIIHAEGVQLGELRHGPMVLLGEDMPVVVIKPVEEAAEQLYEKVLREVASKGARALIVAPEQPEETEGVSGVLQSVKAPRHLSPIASIVPLQLLAYRAGVRLGRPIDTPPGLAKAVTT